MSDTRSAILKIAQDLVANDGVAGVSFDAIAQRLGRSKQAVLYWFPTKQALLTALYVPWLAAEADAVEGALERVSSQHEAIDAFVRAVTAFHIDNMDRFRLTYLAPQIIRPKSPDRGQVNLVGDEVRIETSRIYAALERQLTGKDARQRAVAIHAACLGLVTMIGLAAGVGDPLKHNNDALVSALVVSLT